MRLLWKLLRITVVVSAYGAVGYSVWKRVGSPGATGGGLPSSSAGGAAPRVVPPTLIEPMGGEVVVESPITPPSELDGD